MNITEGKDRVVSVMIERAGDTSREVSVMCTTQERSAQASHDYQERDKKRVTFAPGQAKAYCNVTILDDDKFEPREYFQLELQLDSPRTLARIDLSANILCVYIDDKNDRKLHLT